MTRASAVNVWLEDIPKTSNHFTLLAGACGAPHQAFIQQTLAHPRNNKRFTIISIRGPDKLLQQTVSALQKHCGGAVQNTCPALVLFFSNLQSGEELEEIYRAFYGQAWCQTPEFGGVSVDCTRVWFVFSTCAGERLAREETPKSFLNELESHVALTQEEIQREVRFELKEQFGSSRQFTTRLPLRVIQTEAQQQQADSEGELSSLVAQLQREQRAESLLAANKPAISKIGKSGIDFSLLDEEHFLGQEWARRAAINALDAVDKGIKQTRGPIVLFLLGGSGTGKTLLAKLIAQAYHGGKKSIQELQRERKFAMFAMADYKSENDVDSFTSPRQGLVGKGALIEIFETTSTPVIVFDEIEKAHPSLLNEMMLAMLDDNNGFVQDKKDTSKKYSTADAIFILTSNCFSDTIAKTYNVREPNEREVSQCVLQEMERADPTKSRCAAFAKTEVSRRMKAGHAFSNLQEFGFVIFVPPPVHVVEQMASFFLREYQAQYVHGTFVWTKRAEHILKRRAKERFLLAQTSRHGGLSEVQSFLTGALMQVMRQAMQDCNNMGGKRDVLLHAVLAVQEEGGSSLGIAARAVGCARHDAAARSSSAPFPTPEAINQQQQNWEEPGLTISNAHEARAGEELVATELEPELALEENSAWEWQWLLQYFFAFALLLAVALQPLLAVQFAFSLATLVANLFSMGSVFAPHVGTGILVAWLWPWLGWKALLVAPVINLLLNWLAPMHWIVSKLFRGRNSSNSNATHTLYVSFTATTCPGDVRELKTSLFGEMERRIHYRGELDDVPSMKRGMESSKLYFLCVGRSNGMDLLSSLDARSVVELLAAFRSKIPVRIVLHSNTLASFTRRPAIVRELESMIPFDEATWAQLGGSMAQQEMLALIGAWTNANFIVCDDLRVARLEIVLGAKQVL